MTTTDDAPLPDTTGLEDTLSPVDLPPSAEPLLHPLRWASITIALATLVLLLFNATALRGWAYELAPGPYTSRIIAASERWYETTDAIGLNAPTDTMRGWWESAQATTFEDPTDAPRPDATEDLAPPPPNEEAATEEPPQPGFDLR